MKLRDIFFETWSALASNKGRSALTILGIVIGIAAVIAMTSLIGGVKQGLISELGLSQARMVYIDFWSGRETTMDDVADIKEGVEGYEYVVGVQYGWRSLSSGTEKADASIYGASEGFFQAMNVHIVEGRALTAAELAGDSMVVVLDQTLARDLFGAESPVGKTVTADNSSFTVVGVAESQSALRSQGTAYMPFNTCAVRVTGYTGVSQVLGFGREGVDMSDLTARTESFVRQHFNIGSEDDEDNWGYVYVQSMESIQQELDATLMSFQMMMTAVAGISLLVGGIGIMNMMLTNVTERIREIGLRKALGARRSDVTKQFLAESIALCLIGGVIGFALGYGAAWALSGVASMLVDGMEVAPYFSLDTVLVVVGICVGIGIVFGYGPARRAAKLDPVESLRYQ